MIINKVFAGSNYCYALSESDNKLYSWGMGFNYVLGSRDEENLYTPTVVHPKQFHELTVKLVGAGSQHVVVLTTDSEDNKELPPFEMVKVDVEKELQEQQEQQQAEEVKEEVDAEEPVQQHQEEEQQDQ